jgi:AraC-like DNA-binding protein
MRITMINAVEFRHVINLLDNASSPAIVDRALQECSLERKALAELKGFIPYRIEALVVEHVARAVGDQRFGIRLAPSFDYQTYNEYAQYVLGAQNLSSALKRGQKAFPLILHGGTVTITEDGDHVIVGRCSGLNTVIGHSHLDDGAIVIIASVMRHFLGQDWRPSWIELVGGQERKTFMEDLFGAPVRTGARIPALALPKNLLSQPNPALPDAENTLTLMELPARMGVVPPRTMAETIQHILTLQLCSRDLSEDSVASRLSLGRRTIQRALQEEGTSFRDLKLQFLEARARALLTETSLSIESIAYSLGYIEPKSFQRAFKKQTGKTPNEVRQKSI